MKGCQDTMYNIKHITNFVSKYIFLLQEIFFIHRELIKILKGCQRLKNFKGELEFPLQGKRLKQLETPLWCSVYILNNKRL